jgi:hypothetical protein
MSRITDYGWVRWCETCDNHYLHQEWNYDADKCKECAKEQ